MNDLPSFEDLHGRAGLGVDAGQFGDGCAYHKRRDRGRYGMGADLVAFADDAPRLDAGPRPERWVTGRPMVARGTLVDSRRPAKFTHANHERVPQEAAFVHVV